MPELPEVNTFKKYFDETALQQKIIEVIVADDKILRNVSKHDFIEKLTNRTFINSIRRGKYLFSELDNQHYVQFHFGMTGDFKYYEDAADQPRHERIAFRFADGFTLGFDCPRKFARICYIENLEEYIANIPLGEDALTISEDTFLKLMEGKKSTVKGFLLTQKYLAGVGNLYADEICFQTKIHPASKVNKLSLRQLKAIYQAMKSILHQAVYEAPYYKDYPDDWLWKAWRKEGTLAGKGEVKIMKVVGRTTYYCEGYQELLD